MKIISVRNLVAVLMLLLMSCSAMAQMRTEREALQIAKSEGSTQPRRNASTAQMATIAPLITSQWAQEEPYNNYCPIVSDTCQNASKPNRVAFSAADGDTNGDGKSTVADATLTVGYINGTLNAGNAFNADVADVDKNGKVEDSDVEAIIGLVLGAEITATPQNVVGTRNMNAITLAWDRIEGASSYNIYRSDDGDAFEVIASDITETTFVDKTASSGTIRYQIEAVSNNVKSIRSEVCVVAGVPYNEIWYITEDGSMLDFTHNEGEPFDRSIISHTYENGMGRIVCDGEITRINEYAFGWLFNPIGSLITDLLLPNSVANINSYGISYTSIKEIHIPQNMTIISSYSFADNSSLEHVVFNEGLTFIDGDAFSNSPLGGDIHLPSTLENVHMYAFHTCPNITAFYGPSHLVTDDHHCLMAFDPNYYETVLAYFAGPEVTEYVVPEGINLLENYSFSYAKSLQKITLPESLYRIGSVAFEGCDNLSEIYGPHTTSDHRAFIYDGELQFFIDKGLTSYTTPPEVTIIGGNAFSNKQYIEEVVLSDNVIGVDFGYIFDYSPKLKTVTISARMKDLGYDPFDSNWSLETVYVRAPIPPTIIYNDIENHGFTADNIYVPQQYYDLYLNDPSWSILGDALKPYDYGDLSEFLPEGYDPDSFKKDGEVQKLQSATVGRGIDLVFMGEGFTGKDMDEGGKYEQAMNDAMEMYFSMEPYKTFRNRFNVYSVKVVSINDKWDDNANHAINENNAVAFRYASKIPGINTDHLYVNVIYNTSTMQNWWGRSFTSMYSDGSYVSYNMEGVNNVLIHEGAGHGFAKLADEYVEYDTKFINHDELDYKHQCGWFQNVDYHSTPQDVLWSHFMNDRRYDGQVGIYEGAYTYMYGVYRPSENSMMRYNDSPFNAPSREIIYKAIMRESEGESWTYDYEDFAAYDEINRREGNYGPYRARSKQEIDEYERKHQTPKIIAGGWRDAGKVYIEQENKEKPDHVMPPTSEYHQQKTSTGVKMSAIWPKERRSFNAKKASDSNVDAINIVSIRNNGDGTATMDVAIKPGVVATQFDLMLPDNSSLISTSLNGHSTTSHKMASRVFDDKRVRVVVYSMDNSEFVDGDMIQLSFLCDDEDDNDQVVITNAMIDEIQEDGLVVEPDVEATQHIVPTSYHIRSISISPAMAELYPEEIVKLSVTITPETALNKILKWTSNNERVAVVSDDGEVYAIAEGSAVITAAATDGSGVFATCDVTVINAEGMPCIEVTDNPNNSTKTIMNGKERRRIYVDKGNNVEIKIEPAPLFTFLSVSLIDTEDLTGYDITSDIANNIYTIKNIQKDYNVHCRLAIQQDGVWYNPDVEYKIENNDTIYTYNTYQVAYGLGYSGDVVIPEKVVFNHPKVKNGDVTIQHLTGWTFDDYQCENLHSINLPKTINYLTDGDLMNSYYQYLIVNWEEPYDVGLKVFYNQYVENDSPDELFKRVTLMVPEGTLDKYKNHAVWGRFKNIVEGDDWRAYEKIIIENVNMSDYNDGVYDLQGRKVANNRKDAEKLPAGIYISNHKSFIVK